MSKARQTMVALWCIGMVAGSAILQAASPAQPSVEAARLVTYDDQGEKYFALSLTPGDKLSSEQRCELAIFFDTSASQTGQFRDDALEALESMLRGFDARQRVKLYAVDLEAIPLTNGFVVADGPHMQEAVRRLKERSPLGSTDLGVVLETAATSFENASTTTRVVVYIGDGQSKANLLPSSEMRGHLEKLVKQQIPLTAFAIGPTRDNATLAAIANQTGGMLLVDHNGASPQQFGVGLVEATRARVFWPQEVSLPEGFLQVYPQRLPPLNSLRDTILIGKLEGEGPFDIRVQGDFAVQEIVLNWPGIVADETHQDHAYLPQLVELASRDGGVSLPTVGSAGLWEIRRILSAVSRDYSKLGQMAVVSGDADGAIHLAQAALQHDPHNRQALALLQTSAGADSDEAALSPPEEPVNHINAELSLVDNDETPGYDPPRGTFLDEIEQRRGVVTGAIRAEVEYGLNEARRKMDTDPAVAREDLKLLLETVELTPDIVAEVKERLRDKIIVVLQETSRRQIEKDSRDEETRQLLQAANERDRLLSALLRDQEEITHLMEQFNQLMDEGRFHEAVDYPAMESQEIDPLGATPIVAKNTRRWIFRIPMSASRRFTRPWIKRRKWSSLKRNFLRCSNFWKTCTRSTSKWTLVPWKSWG